MEPLQNGEEEAADALSAQSKERTQTRRTFIRGLPCGRTRSTSSLLRRFLGGFMETEDVAFRIFKGRNPAHPRSDFRLRQNHRAARGFDFFRGGVDGVDSKIVHEWLSRILTGE